MSLSRLPLPLPLLLLGLVHYHLLLTQLHIRYVLTVLLLLLTLLLSLAAGPPLHLPMGLHLASRSMRLQVPAAGKASSSASHHGAGGGRPRRSDGRAATLHSDNRKLAPAPLRPAGCSRLPRAAGWGSSRPAGSRRADRSDSSTTVAGSSRCRAAIRGPRPSCVGIASGTAPRLLKLLALQVLHLLPQLPVLVLQLHQLLAKALDRQLVASLASTPAAPLFGQQRLRQAESGEARQ